MAAFGIHALEEILKILKPDMVSFAEDMSYNHGPMISHEIFQEFMLPYYRQTVPFIHEQGIKALVDSDGDIAAMAPWLPEAGLDGIYPLERQAGVDITALRERFPKLLLMGAFDKMTMSKGESAMRNEFERLLPVMKQGGYIPGVDHQTPPEVSLDNYRIYLKLFEEYCTKAVLKI
jgi:uroporphyrinogen-III decarboxylase